MNKISVIIKGFIVGSTMMVPGVSGGSMAMVLGIYDKLISSISSFFRDWKANTVYLISFGIPALLGIILCAKPISSVIDRFPVVSMFFFIGLVCAIANIFSFSVLLAMGCSLSAATVLAFIFAAGLNYLGCLAILFRHKARWSAPGELGAYVLVVCIMGILDYVLTYGFVALGLSPVASKTISTIIGFVGNFLFRKYLVF